MDVTVVLIGLRGQGKSATGNSILGREAFISKADSSRVTQTCELQSTLLEDGRTINVIDTPGFVDKQSELLGEVQEVKKCIHLARNTIHAFLFVVSKEQRLSTEDATHAVGKLKTIFGENIINYTVLVTCGDSQPYFYLVQNLLSQGRSVFFYNNTKDEVKKSEQVQKLLSKVKKVISNNGGKPFMSQVIELQLQDESTARDATTTLEQRDATTTLEQRPVEAHATTMNAIKEHTTQIIDVVEARLRDTTTRLEQQMEAATLKADERVEKYLNKETSEQRISKSYEEQMTQRLEAVEQRVLDMATRLEQQQAEAHAAQMKVNEIAQEQMTQIINEVELMKDVTTRLEHQLAEAEAARLKADERAQEAQKKLKEVLERAESRRSETISDFGSSSFHVYDPSTYLLQSTIK